MDIGGTHITCGIIDILSGTILEESVVRKSVNSMASSEEITDDFSEALKSTFTNRINNKDIKIGIAMPGPFDYVNGISLIKGQNKFDSLYKTNLKKSLAQKLNVKPSQIIFENDAACFITGEALFGIGSPEKNLLGLTLGTGLGTCDYIDSKGRDLNKWNAPFKKSIAEDYLSTRWFTSEFEKLTSRKINGVKEIIATQDSEIIHSLFEEYGKNLAEFLIQTLDAAKYDLVILGGNISKSYHLFEKALNQEIKKRNGDILIKTSVKGENAALLGAAGLWNNQKLQ
ncbi:ROK family protein [Mangrovivirga cuniculi]|uniref:ROK family protein n=1 Tax=Mangrovivirga cuniculi TaxID=2715131 RepID=UPI001586DD62|nr:ROK family protein [Mangrovivirga cuniculi]